MTSHADDERRKDRRLRAAGFKGDTAAASEIVGSMLLITITVVLMGGLSVLVLSVKPPADTLHADVSMRVIAGSDTIWGTGDEQLRVQHDGGEAIPKEGLSIQVDVSDSIFTFADAGLTGAAFDDGELNFGDVWTATLTVKQDDDVNVEMLLETDTSSLLITSSRVRAGVTCEPDTTPPFVLTWTQSPADVNTTTVGAVTVTADVADTCVGVDDTVDPHLEFRVNDGTNPPWTDTGAMTPLGGDSWQGSIPDQAWGTLFGQSLQYRLTGMTDQEGNSGASNQQSDAINFIGTDSFTTGHTDNAGATVSFSNAQDDSDGGAVATLTETPGGVSSDPYYATTASSGGGVGDPTDATGTSDNMYYNITNSGEEVTVATIDTAGGTGNITQVQVVFEGHYKNTHNDDGVDLLVDAGSGLTNVLNDFVPSFGADSTQTVDVTGLRGSWTFADVQAMQIQAVYDKTGANDAMTVHVDSMWVVVSTDTATDMDIEFTFPDVSGLGLTHILEIEYTASQETFYVEVWDYGLSAWNRQGVALDQSTATVWTYQLSAATPTEWGIGNPPLIRFVDDSDSSPQGTLSIDYAKVVSG